MVNTLKTTILLLFLPALAWGSADKQALISKLEQINSLTGHFAHYQYDEHETLIESSKGSMALKKERLFRWTVDTPDKTLIVSDGHKFWNYDEELEQVTVQPWTEQESNSPAAFLTGDLSKIENNYSVKKQLSPCMRDSDECYSLSALDNSGNYQNMKIGFKQNLLHEFQFLDPLGQSNVFMFEKVQLNPTISKKMFKFTPPAGVDVIESL